MSCLTGWRSIWGRFRLAIRSPQSTQRNQLKQAAHAGSPE